MGNLPGTPRHDRARVERPGASLTLHSWMAPEPRAAVFYIHGTQSHAGWLFETGPALAAAGLVVFALDRRGSGESEGVRGDIASYRDWREDYVTVMAQLRERHAGLPMLLVGQSFGGAIAVEVACDPRAGHDALLLCSPLLVPRADPEMFRGIEEGRPVAIPTPDEWFCSRGEYLEFMKRDSLRVNALTPRFHRARVEMAANYMSLGAPLARHPSALLLPRHDKIVDLPGTRDAFDKLSGGTGIVVELPAEDHYLEFSTSQHALWRIQAAFAVSSGFAAAQNVIG